MNNKGVNKDSAAQHESFIELLGQLANNATAVVHDEIELVIQGLCEKMRSVRCGILTVAAGAVIGFAAFLSFCAALIIKLTSYMDPVFAALITGAALALFGVIIAFTGYRQLKK